MRNLLAVLGWLFAGFFSALAIILSTGHIQFILPGLLSVYVAQDFISCLDASIYNALGGYQQL